MQNTDTRNSENRFELRNRYIFTGQLVMQTAFHIGGGKATLSNSDSPVVLTPEGLPFIPGSSFKGSLRSAVEKLVPALPHSTNLYSCGLIESGADDPTARPAERKRCSTLRSRELAEKRRQARDQADRQELFTQIMEELCDTCHLFGSSFAAALLSIQDLYITNNEMDIVQRRDGVAIDRDSEKAKDRLKYDFEVVPASTAFNLTITLENASKQDLQLISIGLSEFVNGFGAIGGKRSRGLGACLLNNLQVASLELEGIDVTARANRLKGYLLERDKAMPKQDAVPFLSKHIASVFENQTNFENQTSK